MKKFSAALFDLDGTLQDSEVLWCLATKDFLESVGVLISDEESVELVYGRSNDEIAEDLCRDYPNLNLTPDEYSAGFRKFYFPRLEKTDIAIPSSVALLREIAKDMPVAIVSGSQHNVVEEAADRLKVRDSVSLVLGAEDYPRGKPDPVCFLKAAEILGVPANECIVFEDSTVGVKAAKDAGMYCVAISRPDRPKQDVSIADETVSDLSELTTLNVQHIRLDS